MISYENKFENFVAQAEIALRDAFEIVFPENSKVAEAAKYSLFSGGKRIRGVLTLAAAELLEVDADSIKFFAAAVEMLHCYSLIHDDLPCMDDDELRRGKPSCHIAFGEATALLAGDALLTAAFEVCTLNNCADNAKAQAVALLAKAAGARGMVLGQELDVFCTPESLKDLKLTHSKKTGDLLRAAFFLGLTGLKLSQAQLTALENYIATLGYTYQIIDDVLDFTQTSAVLGKPAGSDAAAGKRTFLNFLSKDECVNYANRLTIEANDQLASCFGERAGFLCELAIMLINRKN